MNDVIYRQAAIEEIEKYFGDLAIQGRFDILSIIKNLPSAQPNDIKPCKVCESLCSGDTLYVSSDWDGGIGFDYIRDVRYCPVCGRRLSNG